MAGVDRVVTAGAVRFSFVNQVALVVGGAGGIGSAVCRSLAEAGAAVVCADRTATPMGTGITTVTCDVRESSEIGALLETLTRTHGRLDVLVHCAGVTRDGVLWKLTDADWATVLATNLDSAFYLLRAAVPLMRRGGGGAIVLVSSINGERGKAGQANYAASKAGLNALSRTAARELGRFGIRVNAVAPGWIETPMTAAVTDDLRRRAIDETALGRLGAPDDVANATLFLCSTLARHVTGQVVRVDGGQLIG
jgi:acetoacetyl-CoA reductase/3-oxoacyl-[acyl-carrier protein] reductase